MQKSPLGLGDIILGNTSACVLRRAGRQAGRQEAGNQVGFDDSPASSRSNTILYTKKHLHAVWGVFSGLVWLGVY